MTLQKVIKNKIPIDIDLLPARDLIWSGVCLKANNHIWIMVNFDDVTKKFDGYTIFRNKEIGKYRLWDEKEKKKIKNKNIEEFLNNHYLDKVKTFRSALKGLIGKGLVALFTGDDDSSYYVGIISSVDSKTINVRLIDKKAKWIRYKKFDISQINYVSFGTVYERKISKKIKF